jgi:beta-galactosidase
MTLMNWTVYNLPMDAKFIYDLRSSGKTLNKPGIFFKGNVSLITTGDTFFDVSNFTKGIIWVNGHNLGRYWDIGPQKRLYCPASWLRKGMNEIIIFDLHQKQPQVVASMKTME